MISISFVQISNCKHFVILPGSYLTFLEKGV